MRVILVRHGESEWNVAGRLQGQTLHVPLTVRGRAQAAESAERVATLLGGAPAVVVASDQRRAVETAEIIAGRLGAELSLTPLAREQSLGELEGRRTDELVAEEPPAGVDVSEVRWGGGESVKDVHARCGALIDELRRLGAGRAVVLVSHGDLLRVLLAVLDGRGHRDVAWCPIGNGEVIERSLPES